MSESTRAVLDTNVVLAAQGSRHAASPNAEIIDRWEAGQFVLFCTPDIILEYAEKLAVSGAPRDAATDFLAAVELQPHYPLTICEPLRFLADLRSP